MQERTLPRSVAGPAAWEGLPAEQQPHWRYHAEYLRTREALAAAPSLVTVAELDTLRRNLATVAAGRALLLQAGDCAESLAECMSDHTAAKLAVLNGLADRLAAGAEAPVVRIGRIGGQFAKPRSQPVEWHDGRELPVFRGHLVNSDVPTRAAREHDPSRMLLGYQASARVLRMLREDRLRRTAGTAVATAGIGSGPWASHEALVIDYEGSAIRTGPGGGSFLGSTHLPWIGERTRQPNSAHVRLLSAMDNPVGCKLGPSTQVTDLLRLCELLDPDRVPGRLVLIARMGVAHIAETLPPLVTAVRRAGHPAVWLSDPMHGNTVRTGDGVKTRHLSDLVDEVLACRAILERSGVHPAGLHLEVAADDVTECVGGKVSGEEMVQRRYTTLCDPRLNPEQAHELVEAWT
ncbi:MAG: phospho-2-dehydro-3-deoxyheptonate aldolase [Streptosporangiales bacterium]|nr:phospho-2-dehydro-3-deoxyheptonate aldolase [Streptosporangiales bacterium]